MALGDGVALGVADDVAALVDDAAALVDAAVLAETAADDEATAAGDDAAADEVEADEPSADAAGAACLLDVHAASTRLAPTRAMSAGRCPMGSSLPRSATITTAQRKDRPMFQRVPFTGDEKTSLQVALQRHRDVVLWKIEGLDDDQLRRPMTPSGTSLLGLVKHLAAVEYGWFCATFGRDVEPMPFDEEEPDADLRIAPGETTRDVVDFYNRACRAADVVIGELGVDELGTAWFGDQVSMRWVLIHMVEETARHAGHMDILRELIDGATGDHNRPD